MGNLTFAVAGNGPANRDNIYELLNDWLGYGEKDEEGYYTGEGVKYDEIRLILPLTDEHFTPGVAMVHQWSALANLDFIGVISATTPPARRDVKGAKGETDLLEPAADIYDKIVQLLAEADPQDEVALLVLHEDTEPDEETRALIESAFEHGVRNVLNLSYGLAPLEPPAPAQQQEESAEEEVFDERSQVARDASREVYEQAAQGTFGAKLRAQLASNPSGPIKITHGIMADTEINLGGELEGDPVATVFQTLDALLDYHIAADIVTRMGVNGVRSGPGGPLTDSLLRVVVILQHLLGDGTVTQAREQLADLADEVPQPEGPQIRPEQAAPAPRPVATKKRVEWYDKATGTWRPKGPGRPRKDVELREVDVPVNA